MIRYEATIDPTLFASEVNFSSSTIEVMPQGTATRADRETPTPDAQVRSDCDAALRACRGILRGKTNIFPFSYFLFSDFFV